MEVLQLELQTAKDKISWLEEQRSSLSAQLGDDGGQGQGSKVKVSATAVDIRVAELEGEKEQLRLQLLVSQFYFFQT